MINKNAFQWDAYRPIVDRIPACTAQGECLTRGVSDQFEAGKYLKQMNMQAKLSCKEELFSKMYDVSTF